MSLRDHAHKESPNWVGEGVLHQNNRCVSALMVYESSLGAVVGFAAGLQQNLRRQEDVAVAPITR